MTLADILAAEVAQVAAGATACGQVCTQACHGALTCGRAAHPHTGDDVTPHLGHDAQGNLTQWVCPPVQ